MKGKACVYLIICFLICGSFLHPQETIKFPNSLSKSSNQFLNPPGRWIDISQTKNSQRKNETDYSLDSIYIIYLGGSLGKVEYLYDNQGKLSSYIYSYWDGDKWTTFWRNSNTYNFAGKIQTILQERLNYDKWKSLMRENYSYDSLSRESNYFVELWGFEQWNNWFRYSIRYDSMGNPIEQINEDWIDTSWNYSSKVTTTYYENGNKASDLFELWNDNKWVIDKERVFEYDYQWNLISIVVNQWDGSQWINFAKNSIHYDNNMTEQLVEVWQNSEWANDSRILNEYDENNYPIIINFETWNNNHWISANGPLVLKNPDDTRIGFLSNEISFFYSPLTGITNERNNSLSEYKLSQNFPNPFNPTTKIRYQILTAGLITLKVFDMLGKAVATLVNEYKTAGSYEVEFNISSDEVTSPLPSGVYFYQLRAGDYAETRKLILMK